MTTIKTVNATQSENAPVSSLQPGDCFMGDGNTPFMLTNIAPTTPGTLVAISLLTGQSSDFSPDAVVVKVADLAMSITL